MLRLMNEFSRVPVGAWCKSCIKLSKQRNVPYVEKIPRDRGVIISMNFWSLDRGAPSSNLLWDACFSTRRELTRKGWIPSTSIPQHVHTRGSLNHPWPVSPAKAVGAQHHLCQSCSSTRTHASTMDLWRSCRRPSSHLLNSAKPRITRSTFDPIEILSLVSPRTLLVRVVVRSLGRVPVKRPLNRMIGSSLDQRIEGKLYSSVFTCITPIKTRPVP